MQARTDGNFGDGALPFTSETASFMIFRGWLSLDPAASDVVLRSRIRLYPVSLHALPHVREKKNNVSPRYGG